MAIFISKKINGSDSKAQNRVRSPNKIEHQMFCHITENWRGRPLVSHEVVVNLIGHTTTNTGLTIQAELDKNAYPTDMKVSSEDMKRLNLSPAKFHGKDWNYAIKPRQQRA